LRSKIFWILFLAIFTCMIGVGIIVPLLPIYAEQLGATGIGIGLIFSGFSLARSLFSPLVGRLSDIWGRKVFISFGLFLYWLISLGYIFAQSLASILLVRFVQGFSAAMIIPLATAYIGDIAPKDKEGLYVGRFSVSLFAGFGFGPLIGGVIMHRFGIEANFYLMSLLCLLAFLMVIFFLPNHRSQTSGKDILPYSELLRSPTSQGLFFFRFSSAFARGSLISFLPLLASHQASMNSEQIGIVISGNILLVSFLQAPFGWLADRRDRRSLVLLGTTAFALMMALLPSCNAFHQIFLVCMFMGIGGGLALPAATAMAVEEGRTYGMGSAMGLISLGMGLGLGTGPILAGGTSDSLGLPYAFYLATLVGLAGALAFGRLTRAKQRA
jgi:DHA1 family multidrug resistance protein-like MFS transporter